jgi:hypothetical protein
MRERCGAPAWERLLQEEDGRLGGRPLQEEDGRLGGRPLQEEDGRLGGRPLQEVVGRYKMKTADSGAQGDR